MRVLLTGGAGYIGSITTRRLLDAGHEVVVLDSLVRGHRDAVDVRAEFVEAEVGDVAALARALPECDAILHVAGLIEVGESAERPGAYFEANVAQPARLLEAALAFDVRAVVFSSTAAVYGEPASIPITEDAPTVPVNVYGATKLMFEQMLQWYEHAYGMRNIRLRYFNVAGALPDATLGEAHVPETHIIPRILGSIASGARSFELFGDDYPTPDGTCVRDYIHVCDLAEAHLLAVEHLAAGGEGGVFNLGNGKGFSNREVLSVCSEVTGADIHVSVAKRRPGDPAMLVASADRAREVLGWTPTRGSLRQMVEDAWRWHSSKQCSDSG
ncbi:MAG: UDP-glucose 4-epimerase GalE [Coriobacteriia bacterium]|jgi:UDP-glucose 4-epimerase|nr:UDP-glucose 4-epimerase GalE [Coriobacteriia bacterium]